MKSVRAIIMPLFCKSTDNAYILTVWTCYSKRLDAGRAPWCYHVCSGWRINAMKRTEVEERVRASHAQLTQALEGLSEEQGTRTGLNPQWSVRDALAHIVAWEIQGANIVSEIQAGTWKPQRLNKEMIDDFNAQAVEERRARSLGEVRDEFNEAHSRMESLIATLPDEIDEASPTYKFI